jgi:co-chaperonin GroES (HSP10)
MRAVGTKLVLTRIQQEQRSQSGIILANQEDPNPPALIMSIGSEAKSKYPELAEGQEITVEWQNCAKVIRNGKTFWIADAQSVYAIEG